MTAEEKALERYNAGEPYNTSTGIDEDTILAGYGKFNYGFEFPLPTETIIKEFGTTSWDKHFKSKGLYSYIMTTDKGVEVFPYRMTTKMLGELLLEQHPDLQILKIERV